MDTHKHITLYIIKSSFILISLFTNTLICLSLTWSLIRSFANNEYKQTFYQTEPNFSQTTRFIYGLRFGVMLPEFIDHNASSAMRRRKFVQSGASNRRCEEMCQTFQNLGCISCLQRGATQ